MDGRKAIEIREGYGGLVELLQLPVRLDDQQGMAAHVEEVVVGTHPLQTENPLPQSDDFTFQFVFGRHLDEFSS